MSKVNSKESDKKVENIVPIEMYTKTPKTAVNIDREPKIYNKSLDLDEFECLVLFNSLSKYNRYKLLGYMEGMIISEIKAKAGIPTK